MQSLLSLLIWYCSGDPVRCLAVKGQQWMCQIKCYFARGVVPQKKITKNAPADKRSLSLLSHLLNKPNKTLKKTRQDKVWSGKNNHETRTPFQSFSDIQCLCWLIILVSMQYFLSRSTSQMLFCSTQGNNAIFCQQWKNNPNTVSRYLYMMTK